MMREKNNRLEMLKLLGDVFFTIDLEKDKINDMYHLLDVIQEKISMIKYAEEEEKNKDIPVGNIQRPSYGSQNFYPRKSARGNYG